MRVLVTGAGGMLGRDAVAACEERGHETIGLTRAELDITDRAAVEAALSEHRPAAVVNCAAWTAVDAAESKQRQALRVNDGGAALVAAAAREIGAKFVFISSDYVFDGAKGRPYVETDRPNPISVYGRSKLAGETSSQGVNPRTFVVRSSWLFGRHGKNFVETMLSLAESEAEVLVVADQVGCPTYTRHLAAALAQLVERDDYGVHHIAGSGECSWFEFAQEIFDQAALEVRVMAARTGMLARPAPRPPYSVLRSERRDAVVLPPWRQGLREYLREREAIAI